GRGGDARVQLVASSDVACGHPPSISREGLGEGASSYNLQTTNYKLSPLRIPAWRVRAGCSPGRGRGREPTLRRFNERPAQLRPAAAVPSPGPYNYRPRRINPAMCSRSEEHTSELQSRE